MSNLEETRLLVRLFRVFGSCMKNRHTPVALEGVPFIAIGFVVAALLAPFAPFLAVFPLLFGLFSLYFFRNPGRKTPDAANGVIAPADGTVIFAGPARDEFTGSDALKISIFMSVLNVHINRVPVTGTIIAKTHRPGRFLDVRDDRATFENERLALLIRTDGGRQITVVQVAGLIARRIVCYPTAGERVTAGERYGLIRFGSRLDIYLPIGSDITVSRGDRTIAGETIIGRL
jgi:phosphatidylserine decarboxylase